MFELAGRIKLAALAVAPMSFSTEARRRARIPIGISVRIS